LSRYTITLKFALMPLVGTRIAIIARDDAMICRSSGIAGWRWFVVFIAFVVGVYDTP